MRQADVLMKDVQGSALSETVRRPSHFVNIVRLDKCSESRVECLGSALKVW